MATRCRGITTQGTQCRLTTRQSPYCRYHQGQDCQEEPRQHRNVLHLAPLRETPLLKSPEIRNLAHEENILADQPAYQEVNEDNPENNGLYAEEDYPEGEEIDDQEFIRQLLQLPPEEYINGTYEELYKLVKILGFDMEFYTVPNIDKRQEAEDISLLLIVIEDYIAGTLDTSLLTERGRENYTYTQEYLYGDQVISPRKEELPTAETYTPNEDKQQCCICIDEDVAPDNLLNCRHPVCHTCLQQLTKAECPLCRKELRGKTVTPNILARIYQQEEDKHQREEEANQAIAYALQQNPDADVAELYEEYYGRL